MKDIITQIKSANRIMVTGHVNPDGDCVGAGLALTLALNKLNSDGEKIIRFILQDKAPDTTNFLNHSILIERAKYIDTKYKFDTIIAVDCASIDRLGDDIKQFITDDATLINIDHHISNTKYGHFNYVNPKSSSTSEIIYNFIKELNIEIDLDIAESIYMGIVNDTGNLAYNNVSYDTLMIIAELKKLGLDNEKVVREFFNKKSYARIKLLGEALNNFEFFEDKKLSFYYLSQETLKKYNGKKEDTEGIVEALRDYDKAEVSLFLRETENGDIKGSFRSNEKDVNRIAQIFNGGGHKKAAGFNTDLSKEEILKIVLKEL
ncbi:MAG: bifunctional oligoribonuclease and phosphatase NrnA [Fusobacteriaceae bacterium]|nr:bifunctional oligoribonuclease and phosphatase NrnA [Fusobacteriaceae bacterium]